MQNIERVTALITNRADEDAGPELASILAAAKDFRPAAGRTFELGFNSRQHLSIVTMRHQKIETLAEDLLAVVPS